MKIPYSDDFNKYKSTILENLESPAIATNLQRLNYEVLGVPYSSTDIMVDDDDINVDKAEEDRMRSEFWEATGLPIFPTISYSSDTRFE